MYRKKLIQKLQQLSDNLPFGDRRKSLIKDIRSLKMNKDKSYKIKLEDKYNDIL